MADLLCRQYQKFLIVHNLNKVVLKKKDKEEYSSKLNLMLHECVRYCFYHPSLNQSYSVLNIVKTYLWIDFFILRPGRTRYTLPWDRCWQLCTNWSIPEHQQTGGSRCSLRGGAVSWGNYSRLPRLPRAGADTLWIGGSPLSPLVKGSYLKKQQQSNCYIASSLQMSIY